MVVGHNCFNPFSISKYFHFSEKNYCAQIITNFPNSKHEYFWKTFGFVWPFFSVKKTYCWTEMKRFLFDWPAKVKQPTPCTTGYWLQFSYNRLLSHLGTKTSVSLPTPPRKVSFHILLPHRKQRRRLGERNKVGKTCRIKIGKKKICSMLNVGE